jgi:dTDP-4-amino-4,6-dideoxygalactose transaminase
VLRGRSPFRYYGPNLLHRTDSFERELAEKLGVRYAVAVSSGTAALACGLVGMGMPAGAEVIVPAVTFIACVNAVVWARGVPVFAEVDDSLCLDPAGLEEVITDSTWAVMPVHLNQVAADLAPILAVCRSRGLRVLEDAAQAAGVSYRGRRVGSFGEAGAFSFQLEKNLTAGDGGAVVTDQAEIYDRVRRYQDQGGQFTTARGESRGEPYAAPFLGVNLRMSEIAAAILRVQLQRLDPMLVRMREVARHVRSELGDIALPWRRIPDEPGCGGDLTAIMASRTQARRFADALVAHGIPARIPYGGQPVYREPAVRDGRTAWGADLPRPRRRLASERLVGRSVTIDLGAAMTDDDVEFLIGAIRSAHCQQRRQRDG